MKYDIQFTNQFKKDLKLAKAEQHFSTHALQGWVHSGVSRIRAQLEIYFEERLEKAEFYGNLFDMCIYTSIMQIRAENQNLLSALSNYQ